MSPDASSLVVLPEWFMQMGLMAWPLAVCSILALAVGLERLVFLARSMIAQKSRYNRLAAYLTEHQHHPKPLRDELAGVALNDLKRSYYSGIKLLRLIGMISPIIGLLGTILGIISAFRVISVQTGPVAPSLIADGLWEAMLTTAAGLMIALPALLMAHFFSAFSDRQLDRFCQDLNRLSLSFELVSRGKRSQVVELNAEARRS
ncbi:MotA/TolQ/ExbB proton channel family protein [Sneathiella chungangensis]|uniref:MotA/TolQ/ExbB proton channel family protein n=1 Tax=Sneathiella chungangensis TaxID=1418234 RepID=A0A845MGU5_9PROT|nr:MotA/TolQ/ExbB proton channel family protein [Sneathiella chungangensis]MZR22852.1 MotA/TolQ/ExbB proton channel family protein [Sneathiella chungangensis]